MKEKLIQEVLSTGNQMPRKILEEFSIDVLQFILGLRRRYAK